MADIKVSDLPGASYIYDQDLLLLSQDAGDDLESRKATVGQLKQYIEGIWLSQTLTAGSTTMTIYDAAITTGSIVESVYVPDTFFGVNPTNILVATGSVTITFPAQSNDMPVKVRIL